MQTRIIGKKWLTIAIAVCLAANGWLGVAAPGVASAASVTNADHVVISQVYAGGTDNPSKGTSTYTNDYIELYNPTDDPVDLSGWSIQYAPYSYKSGNWSVVALGADAVESIQPHGYYLIKGYHGDNPIDANSATVDSPDTDASSGAFSHLNKDGGVIALVKDSVTPLAVADPSGDHTVDFVGYGSSGKAPKAYEGAYAPDGSYKKNIIRKGVNTETNTIAVPSATAMSTGYGSGYDSDNNVNDFQQLDNGAFYPRNSSVREPAIKGNANDAVIKLAADNKTVSSSQNQFKVTLTIGTVRSGALTEGTDFTVGGLPAGSFTTTAVGSGADNSITFALSGSADSPISADVGLTVVVKAAALAHAGAYPDSSAIGGIKLAYASSVPVIAGSVVAGADTVSMASATQIGQGSFAVQLADTAHVREDAEAVPYAEGTDYAVSGLPAGLSVSAEPDVAGNRIVFTVANPSSVAVREDAALSVVIKGHAVQGAGALDSASIAGATLLRYRIAPDESAQRKAYVEGVLKEANAFLNDPATKAYKYSTDALAHDAFTLLRGTADVFGRDLGTEAFPLPASLAPFADVLTYSEGDAHFQNVGFFNDSTGTPVFGLNDFDSAGADVFYKDLLRFISSMYVVRYEKDSANISQASDADIRAAAKQFLDAYKDTLLSTVDNGDEKTVKLTAANVQTYTAAAMNAVVGGKSYAEARAAQNTKWIKDTVTSPDTSKYLPASSAEIADLESHWSQYVKEIAQDPSSPLHTMSETDLSGHFAIKSVVRRINQGLGSIGAKRYNVLIEGPTADPADDIVLDVKQQLRNAALSKKAYQAMVLDPDAYLGVLIGADAQYLVREISPFKGDYTKKTFKNLNEFTQYSIDSAKAIAYMQAYSDQDSPIGGLSGSFEDTFKDSIAPNWDVIESDILNAAEDYSHQLVADYSLVKDDMTNGKLIDVAVLNGLSLNEGEPSLELEPGQFEYETRVDSEIASVELTAVAADAAATMTVDGVLYTSGQPKTIALQEGTNTATIVITAQDGVTAKTYTVTIVRGASPALVTGIAVTGANNAMTVYTGGTLQMNAAAAPAEATDKRIVWSVVDGTGKATIGETGLLKGTSAGTVTVKAAAQDGSGVIGEAVITVKNAGGSTPTPEPTPEPAPTPAPEPAPTPTPTPVPEKPSLQPSIASAETLKSKIAEAIKEAGTVRFNDLPQSDWSAAGVGIASRIGFVAGYPDGTFHAQAAVTRAEFAAMLVKALGLQAAGEQAFSDTKAHWASEAIRALRSNGIAGGYGDGTFKPDQAISRAEIVAMLSKTVKLGGASSTERFSDTNGSWAEQAINDFADAGIVNGSGDGKFHPEAQASRAEAVVMILRLLNVALDLGLDV